MQITIQIVGLPQLAAKLSAATAVSVLEAPMKRAQELIRARMADYPPPPPNSSYVRTGDLGRSWAASSPITGAGSLIGTVASSGVDYAPYVEGDPSLGSPSQAQIHQDRWQTNLSVVQASAEEIGRDFTAAIQNALNT